MSDTFALMVLSKMHREQIEHAERIRALEAERDAAQAERDAAWADVRTWGEAMLLAIKDRDAALAEAARLREALEGVLEIEGWSEDHPRYIKARAALAKEAGDD